MNCNPPIGFIKKEAQTTGNSKEMALLNGSSKEADEQFPLLVSDAFASRIDWSNSSDPLLLQILPTAAELQTDPAFILDPLEEAGYSIAPGIIKKYHGRAILQLTGACPIHCRYCFRRHIKGDNIPKTLAQWDESLEVIRKDPSIVEIIYSGGDPLMLPNKKFLQISNLLGEIAHIKRLRIHSRVPVASPERISLDLIKSIGNLPFTVTMVIHMNHADEMDGFVEATIASLVDAGIPIYNQSVLLKGVNDNLESLTALSEALIQARVTPYYLHLLDPVAGAAHFLVDAKTGRQLLEEMRKVLPGFAIPLLVQEIPGELAKTPI
ncbi:MAG: KamA family radical SAM protein [Magnetococcales bacterium]|nr:KamA family radical SAM protein [Magnetococcales bacterium]